MTFLHRLSRKMTGNPPIDCFRHAGRAIHGFKNWLDEVSQIDGVHFMPVDNEISIKSTQLPGEFHKDPADRMIVATARKMAVPMVTADQRIIDYPHVKTIW